MTNTLCCVEAFQLAQPLVSSSTIGESSSRPITTTPLLLRRHYSSNIIETFGTTKPIPTTTFLSMAPRSRPTANNNKNRKKTKTKTKKNDKEMIDDASLSSSSTITTTSFLKSFKEKPGNLIVFPFVALFGIDLILNIAVITKRTIEYFVFGQVPNTEPWW
eukprot:CAMPEP_0170798056 /NCGR_PEP_ID=MMETSP0733-20121128/26063_1 /TAXON_ID=186038 /ORGANISM="Fragilariopsis kerguelensis, Strain L26-C5" /LENGTH=160 /DNA_ID=CAMNT_0011149205 /DNA_START=23 /DNA_END=505 /DNA_ORIENTATION=-